jgi:hypothetical protein
MAAMAFRLYLQILVSILKTINLCPGDVNIGE